MVPTGCGGWEWSTTVPLSCPCRIKRAACHAGEHVWSASSLPHKEGCPVRLGVSWVLGSSSPYGEGEVNFTPRHCPVCHPHLFVSSRPAPCPGRSLDHVWGGGRAGTICSFGLCFCSTSFPSVSVSQSRPGFLPTVGSQVRKMESLCRGFSLN